MKTQDLQTTCYCQIILFIFPSRSSSTYVLCLNPVVTKEFQMYFFQIIGVRQSVLVRNSEDLLLYIFPGNNWDSELEYF